MKDSHRVSTRSTRAIRLGQLRNRIAGLYADQLLAR